MSLPAPSPWGTSTCCINHDEAPYCMLQLSSDMFRASCAEGISPTRSGGGRTKDCIYEAALAYRCSQGVIQHPDSCYPLTFCILSTMYSRSLAFESLKVGSSNLATISFTNTCCSSYRLRSSTGV